jgi:hypothetical protein
MADLDGNATPPDDEKLFQVSRRDFTTMGGAFLFTTWLAGCIPDNRDLAGASPRSAARLLRSSEEALASGGTRKTVVIAWDSLPPHGVSTVSTCVETTYPTVTGDVAEYEISFAPALVMATPGRSASSMRFRYEYTHGPVKDDSRLDTVVMTSDVDGRRSVRTRKTLRPLSNVTAVTGMSYEQQVKYAVDLLNRYGGIPHNLQGMYKRVE